MSSNIDMAEFFAFNDFDLFSRDTFDSCNASLPLTTPQIPLTTDSLQFSQVPQASVTSSTPSTQPENVQEAVQSSLATEPLTTQAQDIFDIENFVNVDDNRPPANGNFKDRAVTRISEQYNQSETLGTPSLSSESPSSSFWSVESSCGSTPARLDSGVEDSVIPAFLDEVNILQDSTHELGALQNELCQYLYPATSLIDQIRTLRRAVTPHTTASQQEHPPSLRNNAEQTEPQVELPVDDLRERNEAQCAHAHGHSRLFDVEREDRSSCLDLQNSQTDPERNQFIRPRSGLPEQRFENPGDVQSAAGQTGTLNVGAVGAQERILKAASGGSAAVVNLLLHQQLDTLVILHTSFVATAASAGVGGVRLLLGADIFSMVASLFEAVFNTSEGIQRLLATRHSSIATPNSLVHILYLFIDYVKRANWILLSLVTKIQQIEDRQHGPQLRQVRPESQDHVQGSIQPQHTKHAHEKAGVVQDALSAIQYKAPTTMPADNLPMSTVLQHEKVEDKIVFTVSRQASDDGALSSWALSSTEGGIQSVLPVAMASELCIPVETLCVPRIETSSRVSILVQQKASPSPATEVDVLRNADEWDHLAYSSITSWVDCTSLKLILPVVLLVSVFAQFFLDVVPVLSVLGELLFRTEGSQLQWVKAAFCAGVAPLSTSSLRREHRVA